MKLIKSCCFSIGIISLSWWIGVKLLLLSQVAFNFSLAYIDDVREVPVGAISYTVIIIAAVIKIYSLGKETFYQFVVAVFLATFLYFLGVIVLGIDLTENKSMSIAEIVALLSISVFSYSLVLGFCKLCDTEEELREAIVFWVIIPSLIFTQILALLAGLGKITSEVFHPMVIEMLPVIWFSFIVMLYLLYLYLSRYYEEKYEEWYEKERNSCGSF